MTVIAQAYDFTRFQAFFNATHSLFKMSRIQKCQTVMHKDQEFSVKGIGK